VCLCRIDAGCLGACRQHSSTTMLAVGV
jgi:hypothetical protein